MKSPDIELPVPSTVNIARPETVLPTAGTSQQNRCNNRDVVYMCVCVCVCVCRLTYRP
jgi:hypothetical protein